MAITIGILGIVAVLAALAWFAFGHGPFDEEGVERPDGDEPTGRDTAKGHFAPGGPGAERQV